MVISFDMPDGIFQNQAQVEKLVHMCPVWVLCTRWISTEGHLQDPEDPINENTTLERDD